MKKRRGNGPNKGKGKGYLFLKKLVGHQGSDCVLWPYHTQRDGYGNFGYHNKVYRAHRFMCELTHGAAPLKHEASHSCGVALCVNPKHLSWKTRSQNELDKRKHGTQGGGAASGRRNSHLTPEQVSDIRRSKLPQHVLAKKYGLKRGGIRYWQSTSHNPCPPGRNRIERNS